MTRRSLITFVVVLLAVTGCDWITVSRHQDEPELPDAATMVDGTEVWDLQNRPTADDVGIDDDTSVFETRPPRAVMLRLPDSGELKMRVRYIAFSTISSSDGQPASVDVKTATMTLDDTADAYRSALQQLGLPTATVAEFRDTAASASGTEWVRTDRVATQVGDLSLGVVARYNPNSETGLVAVAGGWHERSR